MTTTSTKRKALICGISGQDGAFLAKLLLSKGYEVYGSSRDANINPFYNLHMLKVRDKVSCFSLSLQDFRGVLQIIDSLRPHEIYNLAGQSSVARSFDAPIETMDSISGVTLNLLEVLRFLQYNVRLYNACSGECFGNTPSGGALDSTAFNPRSPYAVAKATAFWEIANYREAYGLEACSGILFNHESSLRPERFVTRKIISAAVRISQGSKEKLHLGNLDIQRDWGWAEDFVVAMWKMLQQDVIDDYVIATGKSHSLRTFVDKAFDIVGLKWQDHVIVDPKFMRPSEIIYSCGNVTKAAMQLGWKASIYFEDIIKLMIDAERNNNK